MGDGINPLGFSEMLKFGERVSKTDFGKTGKTVIGYVRELQAKAAYNRTLRTFDAETAEAVAAAVRAGRDPRAILERARRQ